MKIKKIAPGDKVKDSSNVNGIICRKRMSTKDEPFLAFEITQDKLKSLGIDIQVVENTPRGRASKLSIS